MKGMELPSVVLNIKSPECFLPEIMNNIKNRYIIV